MSVTEVFEYYAECPACGASNRGNSVCDYCGASMIKSRTKSTDGTGVSDIEENNERDDSILPHIKAKSGNVDTFLLLFCSIFGGGFILVPLIVMIAFISTGILEPWVLGMLLLFFIIGFSSLIPLVINIRNVMKTKKGDIISGTVRGYAKTATYINGECVLRIKVLIDRDTEPKIVIFNTGETTRMYPINTEIKLRRYENYFSIVK